MTRALPHACLLASLLAFPVAPAQHSSPSLAERAKQQQKKPTAPRRVLTNDDLAPGPPRQEFPDFQFRAILPEGWPKYQTWKNEFTIPCPSSGDLNPSLDEPKCGLAVIVHSLPQGHVESPSHLLESWRRKLLDEGATETVAWRERTVAGLPAGDHELVLPDRYRSQARVVHVFAQKQRRLYQIGLRAPGPQFDQHVAAFEKFLASFEPMLD